MADISVTAASVQRTDTTTVLAGIAGATITAGQQLYKDSSDGNALKPGIATSAAASAVVGIAAHGASDGQPIRYYGRGDVTFNAVLTAGEVYVASASAAGGIAPVGDVTTGNFVTILGVATSTTNLKLGITASGVAAS
jgi:hypothetical protein